MPLVVLENNVHVEYTRNKNLFNIRLVDADYVEEFITVPSNMFPASNDVGSCEIKAQTAAELGFDLIYVWEVARDERN
ncbi:hypothetical protein [Bacillus sp. JJ1562]|uniref:hypothetical protein n=1 Tax=Bacillus sp. JJ1562 TaxID=3122960 RepID=UPI0030019550